MSPTQYKANLQVSLPLEALIFLDVDGVLNNHSQRMDKSNAETITSETAMMVLHRTCLRLLVGLVRNTGARMVHIKCGLIA